MSSRGPLEVDAELMIAALDRLDAKLKTLYDQVIMLVATPAREARSSRNQVPETRKENQPNGEA